MTRIQNVSKVSFEHRMDELERFHSDIQSPKKARKWQGLCYKQLAHENLRIINSPPGSGKSSITMSLVENDLSSDPTSKAIVVCPQNAITLGYDRNFKMQFEKGKLSSIHPAHVYFNGGGTVRKLETFLKGKQNSLNQKVFVCSHSALRAVFSKMNKKEKEQYLKGVHLWIDEAHHSLYDESQDEDYTNELGNVVDYFLENGKPVNLVTATFFRSDGCGVIPAKYRDSFEKFYFPLDSYIIEETGIKRFDYYLAFFKNSFVEAIRDIFKINPHKRTIIYLPHTISGYSQYEEDDKHGQVERVIKAIAKNSKVRTEKIVSNAGESTCFIVRVKGKDIRIINLVDDGPDRQVRLSYIREEYDRAYDYNCNHDEKDQIEPKVDVIISMKVFQEGADYPPLSRVIRIGTCNSMVELIQSIGRALRNYKCKGKYKENIEIYHVLAEYIKIGFGSDEEFKSKFKDHMNAMMTVWLFDDLLFEAQVDKGKSKGNNKGDTKASLWMDIFGEKAFALKSKIVETWVFEYLDTKETNEENWDRLEYTIADVLYKEGVSDEDLQELTNRFKASIARMCRLSFQPLDLANDIDFDMIDEINPADWLLGNIKSKRICKELFNKFRKNRKENDDQKMKKLDIWVENNPDKKPSKTSSDPEERSLARWICFVSLDLYKNGIGFTSDDVK